VRTSPTLVLASVSTAGVAYPCSKSPLTVQLEKLTKPGHHLNGLRMMRRHDPAPSDATEMVLG
jgi:hypothetical protein